MTDLITPSKTMGYSDIYLDFITGQYSATHFFSSKTIKEVAAKLDAVSYDREWISAILERQNRLFDTSDATFENIEKLKDEKTLCAFAGQQVVLFGGPLLIMIKALTVVKAAHLYSEQLQRPVVPIFWMAADDHDFAEINHTWVLNRQGDLEKISYDTPPKAELPASEITFADVSELERAQEALKTVLGVTEFTPELYRLLQNCYTPKDTFVTAFGKLMAFLTRDLGLILFSPGDAEVKQHAAPFFQTVLDMQDELHTVITTTNHHVQEHGYHIQVEKKDNASHLFFNLDGRKPIMRDGDSFLLNGKRFSKQELATCISKSPDRASPDVLLRPVFQSYLFPVVAQKGGPAEIAYFAQINPIFRLFGLVSPYYMARPSVTFVEKRYAELMAKHDITFEELTADIEQVINRVLAKSFPQNLQKSFDQLKHDVNHRFGKFVEESLQFDPSLKQFATQTYGKIDFTLKQFEGKIFASHKKKSKETRDRIYRLWRALYPNRALQERSLNISYFLSRYGFDFIKSVYDKIDCEENAHQIVHLTELTL
ncbi:MAG: bacillithiol biosynthesis cysteine-adding enzyme BshC [Candidatus Zixiibacteriota bacterium]